MRRHRARRGRRVRRSVPATTAAIGALLDDGLSATNPLDVWGTGQDTFGLFGACLQQMADDPAVAVTALAVDLVPEFDGDTAYPTPSSTSHAAPTHRWRC